MASDDRHAVEDAIELVGARHAVGADGETRGLENHGALFVMEGEERLAQVGVENRARLEGMRRREAKLAIEAGVAVFA